MARLTLKHMRIATRLPQIIGACVTDVPTIAQAINAAQQRLLFAKEAGEQGWYASWARMAFNVYPSDPYITLGRYGSRLTDASVCKTPISIQNDFYEFLTWGNGLLPKQDCNGNNYAYGLGQAIVRGDYPAFRDLTAGERIIRVRANDVLDTAGTKRVLIQGVDAYDNAIYTQDGVLRVAGVYLTISDPFVDTPMTLTKLTGIQKDVTNGQVSFYDVNPTTGAEILILTMEPGEMVSGYRRYYFHMLPTSCCPVVRDSLGTAMVQVEANVKLNCLPVGVDSDYLLFQNEEAIIAECQSARYSTMDLPGAKLMAASAHKDAIRLLQGELTHHYGSDKPAVGFYPFGSAALEKQAIGTLM